MMHGRDFARPLGSRALIVPFTHERTTNFGVTVQLFVALALMLGR